MEQCKGEKDKKHSFPAKPHKEDPSRMYTNNKLWKTVSMPYIETIKEKWEN